MCGIVAVLSLSGQPVSRQVLMGMAGRVAHRGPDASGVFTSGAVGLAHSRLSVIDPIGGRQPMSNRDGTVWISFNGEIFNYVELRQELIGRGHRFVTRSDTEVVLHAYEEYGESCVHRFNGQWAFVMWDERRRRLFASRDRLGILPLFYVQTPDHLILGSEIKSIFAHDGVERSLDPIALSQVFTLWCPIAPRTPFCGVQELSPGHNMVVEHGSIRTERYWRLSFRPADGVGDVEDCAERLLSLLAEAVRLRLRSDVPVGVYLSGGLDSTAVASMVHRLKGDDLTTYSVAFADAEFDESHYQQTAISHLRANHEVLECSAEDICDVFPEVVWHAERPITRTAPAPLFLLSRVVWRSGRKVVLTGEGADEIFGGYDIFKETKVRRFVSVEPDSRCRPLLLKRLYPYLPAIQSQTPAYLRRVFHTSEEDLRDDRFSHLPRWRLSSRNRIFFSEELRRSVGDHDPTADAVAAAHADAAGLDHLSRAQQLETETLLPGYILSSQGDRMLMAHGVEGRFPFLDHEVVEYASTMPSRMKMRVLNEKYILKLACRDLVPDEILKRPKQPYRAPDASSFFCGGAVRRQWVGDTLARDRIAQDGVFDPDRVEKLVDKALSGRVIGNQDNMALVGVLSTQILLDQFVRHNGAIPEPSGEHGSS